MGEFKRPRRGGAVKDGLGRHFESLHVALKLEAVLPHCPLVHGSV